MTVHPTRQEQEWEVGDARVTRTHQEGDTTITLSGPGGAAVAITPEIADAINAALAHPATRHRNGRTGFPGARRQNGTSIRAGCR